MRKVIEHVCGLLAGLALFAIMTLTFFDVIGRKLWSQSIPGSFELTELLMVVVIFAAIPLVSMRGEHVVFDSLDRLLPTAVQRVQRLVLDVLIGIALVALAYLMWKTGQQFAINGDNTATLKIAKAPFLYGMGALCAITGLIHFGFAFKPLQRLEDHEDHSGVAL